MPDFLEEKRREIANRLKELEPLVSEYERLRAALNALEGVTGNGAGAAPTRRRRSASRPAASRTGGRNASSASGRRGRPPGSGTRSKEALELVRSTPGISIPQLADKMGIKQNYLYRVLPGLQKDGLVRKEGRGWFPLEAA